MKVRIVKVGVGAAIATAVYYIAISAIITFTGIIIIKLIFWPPCTTTGNQCVIDGWSVAGLAATILGVATTVLTLLGAFAVAAWWTRLDRRVRDQVDTSLAREEERINNRLNAILAEQEERVNKQMNAILTEQEEKVRVTLARVETKFGDIGRQFEAVRRITIDAALLYPPWIVEQWIEQLVREFEMVDAAARMTSKYLDYVDSYLSAKSPNLSERESQPSEIKVPSSEPLYYWEKALRWQKIVESYQDQAPDQMEYVNENVNARRAKVEEWKRLHNMHIEEHGESNQKTSKS